MKSNRLTFAQVGVYTDCLLNPDTLEYNMPYKACFPPEIPAAEVARAVGQVLESHPAVFSTFVESGDGPLQVYPGTFKAEVTLRRVTDEEARDIIAGFARRFDLEHGPMYHAEVLDTPSGAILLYDFHHLVFDGASRHIFMTQLCSALDGVTPSAEPQSYADFAAAQQSRDLSADKAYFDALLNGVEATSLPHDINGQKKGHTDYVIPVSAPDVMERAKALGTAPSSLFLSAAIYAVSRYANTRTVSMTTISNGRQNPLSEGVVGMFVNTLPVVGTVEDISVREFILRNRNSFLEARAHQEYPFSNIAKDYGFRPRLRYTYQYGTLGQRYSIRAGKVEHSAIYINDHDNDCTVTIGGKTGNPEIVINYDTSIYSLDFIRRFAESLDTVVSRFLDNPDAPLKAVSIMSGNQKAEVEALHKTCYDPSSIRFRLFHQSIEHWAEATPDKTAVIACNETLTYRELNEKANILAHALISRGVTPGDRICLLLPRRSWHLISMFGVMKAGAAYIPCDPEYPADRIRLITEDSHARYVITTKDKLQDYGDRALDIKDLLAEDVPVTNPDLEISEDSLAYLIYTSGSTGRPKGVMLRHVGICNYLTDHPENRHFHCLVHDCRTMLCITTVSFDLSLKEIGASLFNGMTLVFANEDQVNDPLALAELMTRTEVDGFSGTPSRLKMFLDLPEFQQAFARCRFVILGGEKYPPALLPKVKELAPNARLFNTYGPTEISVSSNGKELTHSDHITIGKPLLNVIEYVVDSDLNELPVGVTGELLIGGLGVAAGYNDLPEKTAEAFVDYNGERCYKSGDYAYWNADGEVVILGRKDNQIKLNGLRIELGEVETVLCRQPQVKEGVVMIKNVQGHDHLVAYYTTKEKVDIETLKIRMGESLTHYMVPTIFMELEKMPVSPNGKTDLKSLPEPVLEISADEKTLPETEAEQQLFDIVAEIVGNTNFGTATSLISAGLTSLLAIRLSVFVKERMNAALPVRDIMRYPTIKELAAKLQGDGEAAAASGKKPSSAPLSFSQLGVYSECVANPEDIQYNLPECMTMPEGITATELKTAVKKVVQAHPYINVHFQSDDNGETYQCPMNDISFEIPVVKMSEQEFELEKKSFVRPFDLEKGPLYRFEIVETPSAVHLFADFHHLIMDGESLNLFRTQLCLALDGNSIEKEGYDYYSFVGDQKIDADTERFFEEQLSLIEEASALLPDRYDGDESHSEAEVLVTTDLKAALARSREMGVTPASLYLAAVSLVCGRFTAEDTVGLCTISNGRSNLNIYKNFGMFVNTLPLVTRLDSTETVSDYLKRTAGVFMDIMANEDYPFSLIAEKYGYAANIMYAYQVGVINRYRCEAGEVRFEKLALQRAKFPVAVFVEGSPEAGGVIKVQYDSSLFTEDMMNGFAAAVSHVAEELMVREKVDEITVCNEETLALLDSFNVKVSPISDAEEKETVLSLFRKAAEKYPDNTAAVFKERKFTYRELDELTDRIGGLIYGKVKDCGKKEPVVSILIPRNEYMFILPLAAMKAGCAYQPLDPSYPKERLNFMVKDAGSVLLVADAELRPIISEYKGEVILTDGLMDAMPQEMPVENLSPESLFILLYTSGSTGVPKGVMLEHGNLVSFIRWYRSYYDLKPEHNVAAYASFGFDADMMDLYPALTNGATVHIISEDIRLDLEALNEYFEANGITHSFITTQVGVQFLLNTDNHSLKHLSVGGEKLVSVDPSENFMLHNGYGPTECTIFSTIAPVLKKESNIPIGKPVGQLRCYVMDKNLHRLPVGAAGELIIAGPQVGRGYLNRPDKTAEAFFTIDGERAYHSGDIVRYRKDGNIEFVGRKDGQVKVRGFRIELKEVEAVIREFEGVKDVTVQAFDDPNGGKFIAAYIVSDNEIDASALKAFILDRKPPYMVPAVTVKIDKIPLNVNQKVDRKALPKPELTSRSEAGNAPAAPLNALETELKAVIASVIKTEDFSITDVLGYMGLTSISSIRLASLVFKKYGVSVNSRNLVNSGTLQSIENEILLKWMSGDNGKSAGSSEEDAAIELVEAPLTFPQQGVYMDCQMNPETTMYNIPTMLSFPEGTDPKALAGAVRKVVNAHPALMYNFFQTENGVMMRKGVNVFEVGMNAVSADEFEERRSSFARPFNLEKDLLVRAEIDCVKDGPCHLLIDMHHIIADGISLDLVISQIMDVLEGKEIEDETCSYLRFAETQNAKAETGGLKESKDFFDEMFSTYESAANVPADLTSAEEGSPRQVSTPIPDYLLKLKLPQGVSQAHFWYAAFNYALSRFANTKDVYSAFISGGRQNIDITDTVGMFVNTLPFAAHIKDQTVREFINEVSNSFYRCIDHENYPFARIASDYDFKGCASFAYQMGVKSSHTIGGKPITRSSLSRSTVKIPFSIFIQIVDGVPCVLSEYDDSKYSRELALHFTESMVAVAEHFAADMEAKVKQVSIMSERQRLEVEGMHSVNEDMSFPIRTFHEGIERWAAKTPDALALMACDRDMTYREYNSEANRIGRALMARGLQKGDRVVLLLPRRSYYLSSMFAVMKCGGAFIPMDPDYPADRIEYILSDSEGRFVITTSEKVADYPGRAIDIEELLKEAAALPDGNLDVKVDPHDLAYLIYTSGSTGRPKGVMIEHLGAASFLTFYKSDTNFGSDSNANRFGLCQSTVSFDLSVGEIGVQVFNGDTVVFANEDEIMSPVEMVKLCRRTGTQTISGTPSRLAVNLELEDYYNLVKDQMKCVVTGGEKLPGVLLDELEKMDVYIINTYGPTETTMGSSAGVLNGTREIHVGKPFTNYTYQILDSDRNELPVGVMGELCIGGIGLARGYNNMPERTAETFIEWQGKRIYRTGDYAMWTRDGNVIIMGRTDNQVKLNGLRIELGEIETVMSQQEGMRQCVAVIKKLGSIDKLIGYYTVDDSVSAIPVQEYEEKMRADMSVKLTPYMVPGIFVRLDEMPLTPVGKTDIKRLPMPEFRTGGYVAPKNEVEKTFCDIFSKILKVERVGVDDNFFEMGGTSLVAMQLIAEAAKAGYTMVYKNVFDNATPGLLARMLKPDLYNGEAGHSELPFLDDITSYDYSQLDDVLAANNLDTFRNGTCHERMGDVLLAGATGFLGIHVLHNLIGRDDVPHIYCLVRGGKSISSESRLRTLLFYYFGQKYEDQFGERIVVINGDVTDAGVFGNFDRHIDVVINCAANVKHFSAGTDIEDINIKGCQNCIDLCVRTGARFIQTSTGSIAGQTVSDSPVTPHFLCERDLYFGQELPSKYSASKFLAERAVLDAIKNRGLKGKVMRLGNLSARSTDGEFQINFRSNNSMSTLKAFQVLGCIPYERDCGYSEYSPINEVADAIVRLSLTPDGCTVFQPGNVHWPPYGDTIDCMNRIGIPIERVENEEFQRRLAEAMQDPQKSELVQSLIAYKEANDGRFRVVNGWETKAYTAQVLLRLGFRWSMTTWDYVENYLKCLKGLGVFDSDFRR